MKELRPTARMEEIVVLDAQDEALVYDLRSNKAHCLNSTAASVWRSCDGSNTVVDICGLLEEKYNARVTDDFVWLALDQLEDIGLLTGGLTRHDRVGSRREMLKRIGLASMIAVPIIASVVAPRSAYAAASCACVNPGACLTQTTCPSQTNCNGAGICAP